VICLSRFVWVLPILVLSTPAYAEQKHETVKVEKAAALPIEMVRTLQVLQDQIATGSTEAHVAQRALLAHIDERLMPLDPQVWQDSKNVRAAVIYVLSGGKPSILNRLLSLEHLTKQDELITRGALAYVEGREADAKEYLGEVDVHVLPPTLAGQIALVQSALIVREDPARSIQLLDYVRLQLPGTLVEEAALRRAIFVASQIGNTQKFESLSKQYLRRFRYSVYAGNFRQRFAAALTRLDFVKDRQQFSRLVTILNELEPEGQRELYLLVAQTAIDQGQTNAAILASERAYNLSSADKVSAERSKLYKAAALIVTTEGFVAGLGELREINKGILPASDATLLDAALSMASHIRSAPGAAPASAHHAQSVFPASEAAQTNPSSPAISRAQEALGRVDQLFRSGTR
jgi:chemotaxis protein MotC